MKKIIIIGASGMAGSGIYYYLSQFTEYNLVAFTRESCNLKKQKNTKIITRADLNNWHNVEKLIEEESPDFVINCSGIIKQANEINNIESVYYLNSLIPKRLSHLAAHLNFRLINLSTDCVFNGLSGNYTESDIPNANDAYAYSKYLGEVSSKNCITLRTSIIGHEINSHKSLIDWFLNQEGEIKGFSNAFFSGLPTNTLAEVIHKYVIPNRSLSGLYHLSSETISKYHLLKLVSKKYSKNIKINKDINFKIDRSLDCSSFIKKTGYKKDDWNTLLDKMQLFYTNYYQK